MYERCCDSIPIRFAVCACGTTTATNRAVMGDMLMTAEPLAARTEETEDTESILPEDGRWGPWGTMLWAVVLVIVHNVLMGATIMALAFNRLAQRDVNDPNAAPAADILELIANDGVAGSIAAVVASLFCVGAILALTRMRTSDHRSYLGMRMTPLFPTVGWVGAIVGLQLLWQLAAQYGVGAEYSQYTVDVYRTGAGHPAMWIAYLLLIPAFEEFFARGFLYAGWQRSGLGAVGALFATTVVWTAMHFQYTPIELAQVASAGLLLGLARMQTGSIYPPIVMHAVVNFMALWAASNYIV
jgi:membrane protease YdiL (CAAX protease family)